MLDLIGAISLTTLALGLIGILAFSGKLDRASRTRLIVLGVAWLLAVVCLAAAGGFARPPLGIGLALVIPIALGVIAVARLKSARSFALEIPLATLIALHVGRLIGGFFLALQAAGRLSPTFALTAGRGDILIALAALPVAWAVQRRVAGWWWVAVAWNVLGIADLATAVTLGVGSANSPIQFVFEPPGSGAIMTLPWAIIPAFLVPALFLTHIAIFWRLARLARAAEGPATPAAHGAAGAAGHAR